MTNDPAIGRFALLQLTRLGGAMVALLGVVVLSRAQPALAQVPDAAGDALIIAGAIAFFTVPFVLVRRWKSLR